MCGQHLRPEVVHPSNPRDFTAKVAKIAKGAGI